MDRFLVLEDECDRIRGEQNERDQPRVELRLPVLLELFGVDGGAAAETHAQILCGYVRSDRARHEPRLRRGGPPGRRGEGGGGGGAPDLRSRAPAPRRSPAAARPTRHPTYGGPSRKIPPTPT